MTELNGRPILTLEEVEKAVNEVYLLADKGVVRMLIAAVTANLLGLSDKAVWILLVGSSSGGKSALVSLLDGLTKYIVHVDTLTINTFASAYKSLKEVSLLHKANHKVIVFKDFTTITTMNRENLREIMGQMRSIHDGRFDKMAGNAENTAWTGKIGMIACGTVAVQRAMREYSQQGERFINYFLEQPNAVEMTKRAVANHKTIKDKEVKLREIVADYITSLLKNAKQVPLELTDQTRDSIIELANFSTMARSPVLTNFKTEDVEWVPDREMPARVAVMLTDIAATLIFMEGNNMLSDISQKIIYKLALDSIPADRRLILRLLTEYSAARTKSIAVHLNYPTAPVRLWCSQLNALGFLERFIDGKHDAWRLKPEYRQLMGRYEGIKMKIEELTVTEEEIEDFDRSESIKYEEELKAKIREKEENQKQDNEDFGAFN